MSTTLSWCMYDNYGYFLSITLCCVLGKLWYGDIFGDEWTVYHDWSKSAKMRLKQTKQKYVKVMFSWILMATIIQFIVCLLNINNFYDGFTLGLRLFFGILAPLNIIHYLKNPRGNKIVLLIDLSYQILCILLQTCLMGKFNDLKIEKS